MRRLRGARAVVAVAFVSLCCCVGMTSAETTALKPFCKSADEDALRARYPKLPACGNRKSSFVRAEVNGRALLVVGYEADPCCTDVDAPEYRAQSLAFVDGKLAKGPFWTGLGALEKLDAATTQALLQAVLLWQGATSQAVTTAERESLLKRWPGVKAPAGAGYSKMSDGYRLIALQEVDDSVVGKPCRRLVVHEVKVTAKGELKPEQRRDLADSPAKCATP